MRGSYRMMDWELEKVKSLLVKGINNLASGHEVIDFTEEDVNAYNLKEGLEALGYHLEDSEYNHYDFYWYFFKENEHTVCVFFDAQTFELNMSLCIPKDEEV